MSIMAKHGDRPRPGDIVLDGDPHPPALPQFWLMYCGQTAAWIEMPLGTAVGLGPGHIVLRGDAAPPKKAHSSAPPIFGPCLLWPNGWMDQDANWYGGRSWP